MILYPQVGPLAAILEVVVAHQRPGKQPRLAEHLEAVADADDQAALGRETLDRRHYGREAGYGPRPQVVTVGEAAGQHYTVVARERSGPSWCQRYSASWPKTSTRAW